MQFCIHTRTQILKKKRKQKEISLTYEIARMTFRVSVRCFADPAIQITLFVIWNNSARFSRIEENKKKKQYGDAKRYSIEVKRRAEYCVRQCTVRASGKLHLGRQTVASLSFSILRLSRFALLIRQLYLSRSRDTPDDLPPALFGGASSATWNSFRATTHESQWTARI